MKFSRNKIEQFNLVNSVYVESNMVISKVVMLERQIEIEALMALDIKTFNIVKAECEIHIKGECKKNIFVELHELEGSSGYISGKKNLNILLKRGHGEILKYVFTQAINGMIQSETFLYNKRGFEYPDDYNKYWDELEKNGCRMYSNIDKDDLKWMEYASPLNKRKNLFNRFKRVNIISNENFIDKVECSFTDSFHELQIFMKMSGEELLVEDCIIEFTRAPGKACFDNVVHREKIINKPFTLLSKRNIVDTFGKSQGCYHIVDIMLDVYRKINEMKGGIDE